MAAKHEHEHCEENHHDEKVLQEKYIEFQVMEQVITQMQQQLEAVEKQLAELLSIKQYLDDLKSSKNGQDMLVPIANGLFIKGTLKDNENIIVNVGSNVAVNRTLPQTREMLDKQFKNLKEVHSQIVGELQKYAMQAQKIQDELAKLIQ